MEEFSCWTDLMVFFACHMNHFHVDIASPIFCFQSCVASSLHQLSAQFVYLDTLARKSEWEHI